MVNSLVNNHHVLETPVSINNFKPVDDELLSNVINDCKVCSCLVSRLVAKKQCSICCCVE
jgi:hypothetical protein